MNAILSLIISGGVVSMLVAIPLLGVWVLPHVFGIHLEWLFGIVIPYIAVIIFFVGIVYKVVHKRLGRVMAMKILSPEITHKSDIAIAEAIIKSRAKLAQKGPIGPYQEAQW